MLAALLKPSILSFRSLLGEAKREPQWLPEGAGENSPGEAKREPQSLPEGAGENSPGEAKREPQ
jgi:hypothetical protein